MSAPEKQAVLDRMELAFDLYEAAEAMMRQTLRREHPSESDSQIERRIVAWLQERPGAAHGDGAGRKIERTRDAS